MLSESLEFSVTKKAPLYRYDGSPILLDDGVHQLCLPYPKAAAHNWDVIKDQGTVRTREDDGAPFNADKIKNELMGRNVSSLLGKASPADLYFFATSEFYVVCEGKLLLKQRSQRAASPGAFQHYAGGYRDVITGPDGFDMAESPIANALREKDQESNVRTASWRLENLDCRHYGGEISPYSLEVKGGENYPGFTPEVGDRFGFASRRSVTNMLKSTVALFDCVGMGIFEPEPWEALALGEQKTMTHDYVQTTAVTMQPFFAEAAVWRNGKLQVDEVKQLLDARQRQRPVMMDEEKKDKGAFLPEASVTAEATAAVFNRPTFAAGLASFQLAGLAISPRAQEYLDDFRADMQRQMIRPRADLFLNRPLAVTSHTI